MTAPHAPDWRYTPERPTLRVAAPFFAVATLGLLGSLLPPYEYGDGEPLFIFGLFMVTLGLVWASTRRDHRTWVDPAGPLLFFLVLALARDMSGGATSALAPLVILPILWMAMTGTRRDLVATGVLTAAMFLGPILLIGGPDYPANDWRRGLLWTAFAVLVAPVVQRMVRRLAQETARERWSLAELDGILRAARLTSIISTDLDGTIRSFSSGAEALLGYAEADLVDRHGPDHFHDPAEVVEVAAELGVEPGFGVFVELARRNAPSRIWTYVRADGEPVYVRLVITELRNPEGDVTGYLGVAIDVTAGVESERTLAEAETRWRLLMEHLPDMTVVMVDENFTIQVVAGAGAMRQGLQGTEGRNLSDVSNPDNFALLARLVTQAVDGTEGSAELHSSNTGDEHEVVVTPLPADGACPRALILARDVSRDRAHERELVQAKERAERIFTDAPHGVAVLSLSGELIQINAALESMIGTSHATVTGTPLNDFAAAYDDQISRHVANTIAQRGARVETEWTMRNLPGETLHVVVSSRVLEGTEGAADVILTNIVDVSERYRYEQQLAHLADHDALTGLVNRRRFNQELQNHLDDCERHGPSGAVLLLDLDHFKEVNDTLGHNVGDALIASTAALLRSGVRSTDVVARLGGDEFAILLTRADRAAATVVAQGIVDRIRDHARTLDGTMSRVTASIGVATVKAAAEHGGDILALADLTMYDAKDSGRNGVAVMEETPGNQSRTGARLEWKARIERAVDNGDFTLHLQPIMDLQTNQVRSAEALVRLSDSDELVMPSRFLHIAERTGLMPAVDAWVVEHSVALLARLQQLDPSFTLEVNLSGLSIGSPLIERAIVTALDHHGVDPSTLILEVTETAAVADIDAAREFAERMTALGCQFALDDFGAGFGSFYYVKHLLFDYIKIDGEFITHCHTSDVDRSILRSIVGIAHELGKRTVAEFVAESATLEVVRAEGVDLAQGHLIGEPVAFEEFVARFLTPLPAKS
ncbi:hypothetical protein C6I20_01195 [Aeromicrobium sp. A1-2]|uniref:sensor domain-containing protein n=1 Tax=Aeromicrobium sp. A1-2 TaxID=2107713 RepID=UPI000E4937D5|nr:EAL domain-containing protein [Aeromicrobium sp. A1-2]AXT83941.1 hypothetical protein C6I20_01195 [Aeromicrobium sp. A1-2]